MRKFFVLVTILTICTLSVFAASYPRWKSMPLHVYVPQNYGQYSKLMVKAFNTWQQKSDGIVRFKYVTRKSDADIYVDFVDYVRDCGNESAVGCTHSATRNGYFTQNYIEIGMKESNIIVNKNGKIVKEESNRSINHIYGVMLHEIGHAIGLNHSESKDSIMFPIDLNELQYVTNTDLRLLKDKYK